MKKRQKQVEESEPTPANPVKRIVAGVIDAAIIGALVIATTSSFNLEVVRPGTPHGIVILAVFLWYYLIFIVLTHCIFSQSIGMTLVNIKVVDLEYQRLGFWACVRRDIILRPLVLIAPWTIMNSKGKGLHDKSAHTIVVEAR